MTIDLFTGGPWLPILAPIRSTIGPRTARNRALYLDVVRQFHVESNQRYRANQNGHGETYCNIFVWDVTSAMDCEVPHWIGSDGEKCEPGKGRELSANGVCEWLAKQAKGWMRTTVPEVMAAVQAGEPCVAAWRNPVGIGHVAMVIPSSIWQVAIAQAGKRNFFDADVSRGFGNKPVTYYRHM